MALSSSLRSILASRNPDSHYIHHLELHPRYRLGTGIIGQVDTLAGGIFILALALVFEWDIATLDHQGIDYPVTGLPLDMGSDLLHFRVNQLAMPLQEFLGFRFHLWATKKAIYLNPLNNCKSSVSLSPAMPRRK